MSDAEMDAELLEARAAVTRYRERVQRNQVLDGVADVFGALGDTEITFY